MSLSQEDEPNNIVFFFFFLFFKIESLLEFVFQKSVKEFDAYSWMKNLTCLRCAWQRIRVLDFRNFEGRRLANNSGGRPW